MFAMILGAALLAAQAEAAEPTAAPAATTDTWAEAEANVERAKGKARMTGGRFPALPESSKALGHHGKVEIRGIITREGTFGDLRIVQSSGSAELDRIAMDAASAFAFAPATDADGQPIAIAASVPFYFGAYIGDEGLAADYRCDQFLRDMDWWQSVNPGKPFKENHVFQIMAGAQTLVAMQKNDVAGMVAAVRAFPGQWDKAMAKCRKKPDMLMAKALFR